MTSPEATEREKLKTLRMPLKRAARFKLGNLEGPISLWTGQNVSKQLQASTCMVGTGRAMGHGAVIVVGPPALRSESESLLFASFPSSDNLQDYKTE